MALNLIGKGRALRVCDLCGGVDDHPRHVIGGGIPGVYPQPTPDVVRKVAQNAPAEDVDRLLAELLDTGTTDRHMDCCRAAGCPDRSCDSQTAGVEGRRGGALLEHLVTLGGTK